MMIAISINPTTKTISITTPDSPDVAAVFNTIPVGKCKGSATCGGGGGDADSTKETAGSAAIRQTIINRRNTDVKANVTAATGCKAPSTGHDGGEGDAKINDNVTTTTTTTVDVGRSGKKKRKQRRKKKAASGLTDVVVKPSASSCATDKLKKTNADDDDKGDGNADGGLGVGDDSGDGKASGKAAGKSDENTAVVGRHGGSRNLPATSTGSTAASVKTRSSR